MRQRIQFTLLDTLGVNEKQIPLNPGINTSDEGILTEEATESVTIRIRNDSAVNVWDFGFYLYPLPEERELPYTTETDVPSTQAERAVVVSDLLTKGGQYALPNQQGLIIQFADATGYYNFLHAISPNPPESGWNDKLAFGQTPVPIAPYPTTGRGSSSADLLLAQPQAFDWFNTGGAFWPAAPSGPWPNNIIAQVWFPVGSVLTLRLWVDITDAASLHHLFSTLGLGMACTYEDPATSDRYFFTGFNHVALP